MNYYCVETKCGHVGKGNCIYIPFAIMAKNGKEAAAIAREKPRVKHHDKYAIRDVVNITRAAYLELRDKNRTDEYLKCHNVQDQRRIPDLESRIVADVRRHRERKKRDYAYKHKKEVLRNMADEREARDAVNAIV